MDGKDLELPCFKCKGKSKGENENDEDEGGFKYQVDTLLQELATELELWQPKHCSFCKSE